jgi:cytohesin
MRDRDWTQLHLAAGAGDRERVDGLLRAGADPCAIAGVDDEAGRSALHCAVDPGLLMGRADDVMRASVVEALLEASAPVDRRDAGGLTPLLLAARAGLLRCCERLLDAGASIEAVDRDRGWTALHMTRSLEVAALLLDRGADPNATAAFAYAVHDISRGGRLAYPATSTPADVALISGQPAMVELLASRGGRRATTSGRSDAQLAYARALAHGDLATAARLVAEHGFEAFRVVGEPPLLHEALADHRRALATMLIEAGHPLEERDERGSTPLLVAIRAGALDLARLLVARGAELRARDVDGATALHLSSSEEAIEWLVGAGVALDATDRRGRTAVHRHAANAVALRTLIRAGAAVDLADEAGMTPLAVLLDESIMHHQLATLITFLLDAGAKPDVEVPGGSRGTPRPGLLTLVQKWREYRADTCGDALATLLRGGADPDHADRKGWTALHEAAHRRMDRAIAMLRGAGARDDLPTTGRVGTYRAGATAADVARARGVDC